MTKIDGGLSDLFRKNLPGFHFQRIETGGTGGGIPDTNYAVTRPDKSCAHGWIEYKQTDGWTVPLETEQCGWIDRRWRMGCAVWIAVRRRAAAGPRRGPAVDELWFMPGAWAIPGVDTGLKGLTGLLRPDGSGLGPHQWAGGPSAWGWGVVRGLLVR